MLQRTTVYAVSSSRGGMPVVSQYNPTHMVFEPMSGNGSFDGLCWAITSHDKKGELCIEIVRDEHGNICELSNQEIWRIKQAQSTHHFWFEKVRTKIGNGPDGAFQFAKAYSDEFIDTFGPAHNPLVSGENTPKRVLSSTQPKDGGGSLV